MLKPLLALHKRHRVRVHLLHIIDSGAWQRAQHMRDALFPLAHNAVVGGSEQLVICQQAAGNSILDCHNAHEGRVVAQRLEKRRESVEFHRIDFNAARCEILACGCIVEAAGHSLNSHALACLCAMCLFCSVHLFCYKKQTRVRVLLRRELNIILKNGFNAAAPSRSYRKSKSKNKTGKKMHCMSSFVFLCLQKYTKFFT